MLNPIKNLDISPIVFEKPGILSKNLKTATSSNYPTVQYFLLNLLHVFPTYQMSTKGCAGSFFLFRSWVICKN